MAAKTITTTGPVDRAYLALIREFPLRPIRSDAELDRAIAMVDALSDRESLTPDEHDYLLVLSGLIENYEDERYSIPAISGVAMLRYLIESKGSPGPRWRPRRASPSQRSRRSWRASGS
jgi:HTH-type transcriptional regulator/antitoxin HigA